MKYRIHRTRTSRGTPGSGPRKISFNNPSHKSWVLSPRLTTCKNSWHRSEGLRVGDDLARLSRPITFAILPRTRISFAFVRTSNTVTLSPFVPDGDSLRMTIYQQMSRSGTLCRLFRKMSLANMVAAELLPGLVPIRRSKVYYN